MHKGLVFSSCGISAWAWRFLPSSTLRICLFLSFMDISSSVFASFFFFFYRPLFFPSRHEPYLMWYLHCQIRHCVKGRSCNVFCSTVSCRAWINRGRNHRDVTLICETDGKVRGASRSDIASSRSSTVQLQRNRGFSDTSPGFMVYSSALGQAVALQVKVMAIHRTT